METKTTKVVDLNLFRSKKFILNSEQSLLVITEEQGYYHIDIFCKDIPDAQALVEVTLPLEKKDDFDYVASNFDGPLLSFYDSKHNKELQVGYALAHELIVFFEILDYDYDATTGNPTMHQSFVIDPKDKKLPSLKSLINFLKNEEYRKESEIDEPKFNNLEYKRTIGL